MASTSKNLSKKAVVEKATSRAASKAIAKGGANTAVKTLPNQDVSKRLIVGISGASGIIYGVRILQVLQGSGIETHLVMSDSARMTLSTEMSLSFEEVCDLATQVHNAKNIGATISSGSFKTMGMVVAPCSIRSLSEIAYGLTSTLLSRAADVVLKERRRLVLMVRETPLHAGHLKAMTQACENGAILLPPMPAFYARPKTLDDMVNHTVGRCLDLFDIETDMVNRWAGMGNKG
jgi:flavin prenyltransferase